MGLAKCRFVCVVGRLPSGKPCCILTKDSHSGVDSTFQSYRSLIYVCDTNLSVYL
jgi:hypothetical protein